MYGNRCVKKGKKAVISQLFPGFMHIPGLLVQSSAVLCTNSRHPFHHWRDTDEWNLEIMVHQAYFSCVSRWNTFSCLVHNHSKIVHQSCTKCTKHLLVFNSLENLIVRRAYFSKRRAYFPKRRSHFGKRDWCTIFLHWYTIGARFYNDRAPDNNLFSICLRSKSILGAPFSVNPSFVERRVGRLLRNLLKLNNFIIFGSWKLSTLFIVHHSCSR